MDKRRRRGQLWLRIRRNWQLYALLFLPVLWLLVFRYAPMYGAQIAFRQYSPMFGIEGSPWIGLANFERFYNSPKFEPVIINTVVLSFYSLLVFPIPIILALSINQIRSRLFRSSVQMITYAPHFISTVVIVGMLFQFMHPRVGFTAALANMLGQTPPNWMGDPGAFRHIFVWSGVWQEMGFNAIIYLAVLTTIDPALHEAAVVDGASRLQRIRYIDIPGLIPTAMVLLVLSTGRVLEISFEKVYLMQTPLNLNVSEVINTYVYKVGLLSPVLDFSYSTAIGLLKGLVGLLLMITVNNAARRLTDNSVW
ncbi:MAG: sugar ABC transporter permease [Chloroflexi bacterium]|nr:sugar ABC transporter permease [Chloroflexota bacterium]MXX84204.1 sugar ABC transporter permease [Chloroflexota bacterium]MYA93996.1 sugar ABC transporter permease [Chloroflexota bacterium]MYC55041.1 sugar ABC transporter permease [Chloroflexota bacterium]MYD37736.1 sugar ABC transporter permease [Chloroflexota bacterium]